MQVWRSRLTELGVALLVVAAFAGLAVMLGLQGTPRDNGTYPVGFTPPAAGTPWPTPHPFLTAAPQPSPQPTDIISP